MFFSITRDSEQKKSPISTIGRGGGCWSTTLLYVPPKTTTSFYFDIHVETKHQAKKKTPTFVQMYKLNNCQLSTNKLSGVVYISALKNPYFRFKANFKAELRKGIQEAKEDLQRRQQK